MASEILVVEDNPSTLKLVKFALEKKGYSVLEAKDAKTALSLFEATEPELVLQDLVLPDLDGFELVTRLRALPGGNKAAILAFSGLISQLEESRIAAVGFDDVIVKPIEPSRLIPIIEAHLAAAAVAEQIGAGRKLVLADDDPIQLKLTRFRLERVGYTVECASDGQEALELAQRVKPDAIVSDVLMPRLDGFGLALRVRLDRELSRVPILLITSNCVDETDRDAARRTGANDLIWRTPDHRELLYALRELVRQTPAVGEPPAEVPIAERERADRVVHQLERQVTLNSGLARRCSALAAELSVLAGLSAAVAQHENVEQALDDALSTSLDVGSVSAGILYLLEPNGTLRVGSRTGRHAVSSAELSSFFERQVVLHEVMVSGQLAFVPSERFDGEWGERVLRACHADFAVIVPLVGRAAPAGALFIAVKSDDAVREDWGAFAQGVGNQLAQAVALARAFSEKEQAERVAREHVELLRASEERFRAMFEQAAVGVAQVAPDGRWLEVNQRLCELLGYSREELVGMPFARITYPEDLAANQAAFGSLLRGESKTCRLEKRFVRKDGELIWIDLSSSLVRDGQGAPHYLISVIQDISARKQAEAEVMSMAAQLRQAQKMEAVGRLAGGVAHDFNNLLSVIMSYGELMLADVRKIDPLHPQLDQIVQAARRGAELTRQLLVFSRGQVISPSTLDLNDVCRQLSDMLHRILGEDVELGLRLDSKGKVFADSGQIEQVIMNLVVNSRDAMPTGGKLTIETSDVELNDEHARAHLGVQPGRYVMLSVSDTGTGIDSSVQAHVFEPFFTTKPAGRGTGLGLSTVFGIVKQSGGTIWLYSEPGHGTTFKIYLPVTREERTTLAPPPRTIRDLRGKETILLVEDDEQVRLLAHTILSRFGYHVLEAHSAIEAIAIGEQFAGDIDLLLTDVVLPRMGGRELAERVASMRPDTKVLFMSGYTDEAVVQHGILSSAVNFVQKPFMVDSLLGRVREVLDTGSSK